MPYCFFFLIFRKVVLQKCWNLLELSKNKMRTKKLQGCIHLSRFYIFIRVFFLFLYFSHWIFFELSGLGISYCIIFLFISVLWHCRSGSSSSKEVTSSSSERIDRIRSLKSTSSSAKVCRIFLLFYIFSNLFWCV